MKRECRLCGQMIEADAMGGHTTHCKRRRRDAERALLVGMVEIAREVVGYRYSSTEPTEIAYMRMMLDKYDNWLNEVSA